MKESFRRFEILLPLQFNDGRKVTREHFAAAFGELKERFGAVSTESQIIVGEWEADGKDERDRLVRVFVDVPDTDENRAFFAAWKGRLKERFAQLDIWATSHPVDVI